MAADPDPRLAHLVAEWDLELGERVDGPDGTLLAVTAAGEPALLELDAPGPAFAARVATMVAAGGRGYARVLAADAGRGALLLERLGPDLWDSGFPPDVLLRHLGRALRLAWEVPPDLAPAPGPGADRAAVLAATVAEHRRPADEERWGPALAAAYGIALELAATREPDREVLCHGDPNPGNALLAADGRYRLVRPDGFRCEPEYDVGVGLRDLSDEILTAPHDANARALLDALVLTHAEGTRTDADRVWAWAYVERVSTGLQLRWFGEHEAAVAFLDSAVRLVR